MMENPFTETFDEKKEIDGKPKKLTDPTQSQIDLNMDVDQELSDALSPQRIREIIQEQKAMQMKTPLKECYKYNLNDFQTEAKMESTEENIQDTDKIPLNAKKMRMKSDLEDKSGRYSFATGNID